MGQRTLKRVPLDFDWPVGQVWVGYLYPPELVFPPCTDCQQSGLGVEARAIANTFYPHQIGGYAPDQLAWHDKLGQAEVDYLVAKGRLRVWVNGKWEERPRLAAEVNAAQRNDAIGSHDAINRMVLVEFRCTQLGIVERCPTCAGHGYIATDEQREAEELWNPTEPPTGSGWQLWETTSEGSPVSPVFPSPEELAAWCAVNATTFGAMRATSDEWLSWFMDGDVELATTMIFRTASAEGVNTD